MDLFKITDLGSYGQKFYVQAPNELDAAAKWFEWANRQPMPGIEEGADRPLTVLRVEWIDMNAKSSHERINREAVR